MWGMEDQAFSPESLTRWSPVFRNVRCVELATAGHFVQEEAPDTAVQAIRQFLEDLSSPWLIRWVFG